MDAALDLRLVVSTVTEAGARQPLAGAQVDIWHCDALGVYSDVRDRSSDTTGKKFLRGYQVSDDAGQVRFTTIYPGWYGGRAVHVHFKIRRPGAGGRIDEFTSQLYFDDALDRSRARRRAVFGEERAAAAQCARHDLSRGWHQAGAARGRERERLRGHLPDRHASGGAGGN